MSPPQQKPGSSRQDYETPSDFLEAVARRFGPLDVDLACRRDNAKAPNGIYFPEQDSLRVDWAREWPDANLWLNPEFRRMLPWATKCAHEGKLLRRGRIFLLSPAAVCTDWWLENVHDQALVLLLFPRLTFVGEKAGYPKDLTLSVYGAGVSGYAAWRWKDA